MKRVVCDSIKAKEDLEITFTPVEIVDLLRNIDELAGKNISYVVQKDGTVEFLVDKFAYSLM